MVMHYSGDQSNSDDSSDDDNEENLEMLKATVRGNPSDYDAHLKLGLDEILDFGDVSLRSSLKDFKLSQRVTY